MKKVSLAIIVLLQVFFFSGCMSTMAKKNIPKIELEQQDQVDNTTKYDDVLYCVDDMLSELRLNKKPINIILDDIKNETSNKKKLPHEFKSMLITAINKLGSTVVLTNDSSAGDIDDVYKIVAAITEYDQLEGASSGVNLGISFGGGSGQGEGESFGDYRRKVVNIAMDFNLVKINPNGIETYEPFVSSSYKMKLVSIEDSNDFGISINGNGFGIKASAGKAEALHYAIRLLIEISLSELMGENEVIPYWNCIGKTPDTRSYKRRLAYLGKKYNKHNLKNAALHHRFSLTSLKKFKKLYNIHPVNSKFNDDVLFKLFTKLPLKEDEIGRNTTHDYFEKYNNIEDITIYSKAMIDNDSYANETKHLQAIKFASLIRLLSGNKKKFQIINKLDQDDSFNSGIRSVDALKKKLIREGINEKRIFTKTIFSTDRCAPSDKKCKFYNRNVTFKYIDE